MKRDFKRFFYYFSEDRASYYVLITGRGDPESMDVNSTRIRDLMARNHAMERLEMEEVGRLVLGPKHFDPARSLATLE